MTTLLVAKQYIKLFYSKFEIYITPVLKFLLALIALLQINSRLGYMAAIDRMPAVLVVALMCSFMPTNFTMIMYNCHRSCFSAHVLTVFQIFPKRYGGSRAYTDLFSA